MKIALSIVLLALFPSLVLAVPPIQCADDAGVCIPITASASGAPAIQLEARASPGVGQLIYTNNGTGLWSGALQQGGTAIWAVGINGATALQVQGPMKVERNARSRLKVYNPTTGALVGEFEFEVVLVP